MARVPAVRLDFVRKGGSRIASPLLLAGIVAALSAALVHREIAAELRAGEARLEEMRAMSRRARPAIAGQESDTPEIREQIAKANAVLAQMNVPWSELFAAVESASDDSIPLLAVQPDPRTQTLLLGGQGKELRDVLSYMDRLQQTQRLHDVVLVTHEVKLKEPGQPVEFALSARWQEGR